MNYDQLLDLKSKVSDEICTLADVSTILRHSIGPRSEAAIWIDLSATYLQLAL